MPDIVFNEGAQNVIYARTDIGGMYRWNQGSGSWTPLTDWVGWTNWNQQGIVSIAADPVQTNRVYAAVGMYTNSWDPNNGAILRSTDQGATWTATALPFKLGGNMPGRGMGERLMVDPNDDAVLYMGMPSGHGLWRSTDYGVTWAQVTAFPNVGNYVQDSTDTTGYLADNQGVTWVAFDKAAGTANTPTKTIFVGVADLQNTVYASTDAGATWTRVANQPTGFLAHKGLVDPTGANLYITTSNKGGPYDGGSGDVWKYTIASNTWTQISPVKSSDTSNDYYGYAGLAIDHQHPNTIMVTGYSSWWPDTYIYRSTDGGGTWTNAWAYNGYPTRVDKYTLDVTASPWLSWGNNPSPPEETPKLGWMSEGLAIDPFNSDRMMYGTGATLYGTTNLTAWDSGSAKVKISVMAQGIEETAVTDLVSPPSGAPLLSALGDVDGFRHTDLTKVPPLMYQSPNWGTSTSLDYAESNPNDVVRVGDGSSTVNSAAFSSDNGADWWTASAQPSGVTAGGTVAMAADGSASVWSPTGAAVSSTTTSGSSWTASTGIPAGAQVRSDRVNPKKFYGYSYATGTFYISTDGGKTFAATAATGLPSGSSGSASFHAVPGTEGDLWLAGGSTSGAYGLWHSTNSGATWTKLTNVAQADNIGFGASAPGRTNKALYTIAQISGTRGIFRSDDYGASWVRINDDQHQWGNIGAAITGDPRIYGRVYVGTNGRGIVYGDLTGGSTSSTSSTSSSSSSSPSSSSSSSSPPSSSPSTTPSSGAGCHVVYAKASEWGGGFTANVTLTNTSSAAWSSWTTSWKFPGDQKITSAWNATATQTGNVATAVNMGYNGTVATGASTSFGFQGTWTSNDTDPPSSAFSVNGVACT
ncbi:cellulose binding domain-containing protein [Catenulispora yoronensis]